MLVRMVAILVLAVLPLSLRAAERIDFGAYHALVIGINDYAHLPKLETAVNDAVALHEVLRQQYGFDSTLLINPNRYDLVHAIDKMRADLTEQDNLLLFYAGHKALRPLDCPPPVAFEVLMRDSGQNAIFRFLP